MRKIAFTLAAVTLAGGLLAACDDKGGKTAATPPASAPAASAPVPPASSTPATPAPAPSAPAPAANGTSTGQ